MKELIYLEAIEHVCKYKTFIRVGAIADAIGINQGHLRLVINKTGYMHDLSEHYRKKLAKVVQMMTSVEQIAGENNEDLNMLFSDNEIR